MTGNGPVTEDLAGGSAERDSVAARLQWARATGEADSPLTRILRDPAGVRFGRYRIESLLGSGGMGFVFRARDDVLSRPVALKLLRESDPIAVERLLVEARSQARLRHENVCQVFEAGIQDSIPFVAMQFVEGDTLDVSARALTLEQKVKVVARVAGALHAAHREGVVHRDVKPGNILVEVRPDGELHPWLVDFGLAREAAGAGLTTSGFVVGTPHYMAPEQARGEKGVDRRVDVYGLGATLYELLAGRPVFVGENAVEVMVRVLNEEPRPLRQVAPAVPADLGTIVDTCLAGDRNARYDSARALADDLERFLAGEPIAARPLSLLQRLGRFARRHRTTVSVALALLLALVVVSGLWVRSTFVAARRLAQARGFAQEAERIETSLRMAYLLPLHDTRPEKKRTRERMARLERRLRELGAEGRGPGLAALGRGHLALREHEKARVCLEEAWASGYQDPAVAEALGLTFAALYQQGLENARRIDARESREARLAAIAKELRTPAREWLRRGRAGESRGSELAEGLLARVEGDLPAAEAKARLAVEGDGGLFEAIRLQGDVVLAQAVELQRSGQTDAAAARFAESGDILSRAALVARSDPETHEALCRLQLEEAVADYNAGRSPEPAVQRGLAACGDARKADPDSPWARELEAWLLFWLADYRVSRGIDPRETLEEARRRADEAIPLLPPHPEILNVRGQLGWVLAKWANARNEDPTAAVEGAIADYRRAIRIDPTFAPAYGQIGNALQRQVEWERSKGLDARPTLQRAIRSYEEGIARSPRHQALRLNLAGALLRKGYAERQVGGDALADFERAARVAGEAEALNPSLWVGPFQRANAYLGIADTLSQQEGDPIPSAELAIAGYQRVIELKRDQAQAWVNLGIALNLRALAEIASGASGEATLLRAEEAARKATEVNPKLNDPLATLSASSTLRARAEERRGLDPAPALRQATAHLDAALALSPRDAEVLRSKVSVCLQAFESTLRRRKPDSLWLEKARKALDEAASSAPDAPTLPYHRAHLLRVDAEWRLARRLSATEAVDQGLAAAEEALRRNPASPASLEREALRVLRAHANGSAVAREEGRHALATLKERIGGSKLVALDYDAFLELVSRGDQLR